MNNSRPKAAAIYCRISQDREGAGLGVARQEKECRELATRLGWVVAEVYKDNDTPSKKAKRREDYERMTADAAEGRIDAILCWHTDRLTRQPRELEDIIDLSDAHGVALATVQGQLDLATPNGRMVARMLGAAARQESEQKSERQKAKNRELRSAGKPTTGARPFGYEVGGMVVREDEAEMIRQATKRILEGGSLGGIAKEWNAAGVLTARGGEWRIQSLKVTLTRHRNAAITQENGEPTGPAAWPAIVSAEDLSAVRATLNDATRRTNPGSARKHMLSGLITCGKCSSPLMWARTTTRAGISYELYQCRGAKCSLAILKDVADKAVTDHVAERTALPSADLLAQTAEIRSKTSELRKARALLDQEETAVEQSKISRQRKLKEYEDIEAERQDIDAQLDRLVRQDALTSLMIGLTPPRPGKVSFEQVLKAREVVRERFEALPLDRQRTVIRALCNVTVEPHPKGVRATPETAERRVIVTAVQLA